jgi:hypothetical protein
MKITETENSLLIQLQKNIYSYKIHFENNLLEIQKSLFGLKLKSIKILFDTFINYQGDNYFYLKNKSQRVSVIYTSDLELDYFQISMDNGETINITSNIYSEEIYNKLVRKLINCGNTKTDTLNKNNL